MACAEFSTSGPRNSWCTSLVKLAQKFNKMAKQAKKVKKIRKAAKKGQQNNKKGCYKRVAKIVQLAKKSKYFSKVDPINLAQFLMHPVQCSHGRTQHSDAPCSAHQCGMVSPSSIADENFPYRVTMLGGHYFH